MGLLAARHQPFAVWTDTPNLKRKRSWAKSRLRSRYLKWVFQRQATFVMGTGTPALDALIRMGCPEHKLVNFPYYVDLTTSMPAEISKQTNVTPQDIAIVSIGRYVNAIKGHNQAIEAVAAVLKEVKDVNIRYTLIGSGEDQIKLEDLVRCFSLQDRVHICGWMESADVRRGLAASDILLQPSISEPYGVTILEAMAEGTAVIASDACGAALDRIQHRVNGCIYETGRVEQLAREIKYLVTRPVELAAIKKAGQHTAQEWPVSRGLETIQYMLDSTL
jgi:glycosyltransferase involved in cell wall biosynthesis